MGGYAPVRPFPDPCLVLAVGFEGLGDDGSSEWVTMEVNDIRPRADITENGCEIKVPAECLHH